MPSSTTANAPARFDRARVRASTSLASRVAAALHAEAAEAVHRLRRQADVAHDRDVHARDRARSVSATRSPPSSFTACAPPSFIRRPALRERLLDARLVACRTACRRPPARGARRARPGACGRPSRRASPGSVVSWPWTTMPRRVADQQHVDAGRVEDARERVVVRGEHRDLLAARLAPRECRHRDPCFVHLPPPQSLGRLERPTLALGDRRALSRADCGRRARSPPSASNIAPSVSVPAWDPSFRALSMRTEANAAEPKGAEPRLSTTRVGEGLGQACELHFVERLAAPLRIDAGGFERRLGVRKRLQQRAAELLAALLEGRAHHPPQ